MSALNVYAQPTANNGITEYLSAYLSQSVLALIIVLLLVVIYRLKVKLRKTKTLHTEDLILQRAKTQLRREIARHESTEEQLSETQEYLNSLINSLPAVVIGVTDDGVVTHWNSAAEQTTGTAKQQALGQKVTTVFTEPPIPMDRLHKTIKSGVPFKEHAIALGEGVNMSYCDLIMQPLISPENPGAVILVQDVSLRVRMERSMIQNEKMLSLGKMAAGLAHEINNPLAAILSNTQTLERRLTAALEPNIVAAENAGLQFKQLQQYLDKRDIPALLTNVQNAGDRAAQIVQTMLEFSHAYQSRFEYQDMAALIDKSLELAANTIGLKSEKNLKMPFVIRDYDASVPRVACSSSEIQQVLLNLLLNAAQAIHYARPAIENPTINVRLAHGKNTVKIEIKDNGPGMPDAVQKHIFEPFYTTKEVGSGTGLGLSVSYFIIKDHHQGHIEVDSEPGTGTTFTIRLPIDQLHPTIEKADSPETKLPA